MKRRHLRLLNQTAIGHGIFKYNIPVEANNPENEENADEIIKDYRPQRAAFMEYHRKFERQIYFRHKRRDKQLQLPHYDYIILNSFRILKEQQLATWGLRLVSRTDWGLTLTAQIVDENRFDLFMAGILEYANDNNIVHEIPSKYKSLTQINRFSLLSTQEIIGVVENTTANVLLTGLESEEKRQVFSYLINYAGEENVREISQDLHLYEIDFNTIDRMRYVADNLDIIQSVQSIQNWHVGPTSLKMVNFYQELDIDMSGVDILPVVGLIDTGIRDIPAINGLIVERAKLNNDMVVRCGHGTNVASLILFGRQRLDGHLVPQARIYSIQVLEDRNGKVSLNTLKEKIVDGITKYNIKVFNISLSDTVCKEINEGISNYAKVLDEIAYQYDVLFVTATGNIKWEDDDNALIPYSHYNSRNPLESQGTNIGSPAENMNGITVGAVGTQEAELPINYTRKSHIDYTMPIKGSYVEKCIVNANLMKPDILSEGGDDMQEETMIDVIEGNGMNFIVKSAGTSLAAPLITNLCARIIRYYPELSSSAVKCLVINSAVPTGLERLEGIKQICDTRNAVIAENQRVRQYHHLTPKRLCRMIEGHGFLGGDNIDALVSDDNIVTFVGDSEIRNEEIRCVNLLLPRQLTDEGGHGKKLRVSAALCFMASAFSGSDIIYYNPYHISFRILHGNEDVRQVAENASYIRKELSDIKSAKKTSLHIKSDLDTWSDDPLPSYIRKFFSNSQKKSFLLNYNNIVKTGGIVTLAFRCVTRPGYDAVPIRFAYTIKLELIDNVLRDGDFVLYDKIEEINQTEAIGNVITDIDIEL